MLSLAVHAQPIHGGTGEVSCDRENEERPSSGKGGSLTGEAQSRPGSSLSWHSQPGPTRVVGSHRSWCPADITNWGSQGQAQPRAQASHVTLSTVKLPTQTNTLVLKAGGRRGRAGLAGEGHLGVKFLHVSVGTDAHGRLAPVHRKKLRQANQGPCRPVGSAADTWRGPATVTVPLRSVAPITRGYWD